MSTLTSVSGFPRIGQNRELKKIIEGYWKGANDLAAVKATAAGVVTKLYVDQGDMVSAGAPIADILDRGVDLCFSGPVAVVCGSGYRSNIIGSALAAKGCSDVRSVAGGMTAWTRAGLPKVSV